MIGYKQMLFFKENYYLSMKLKITKKGNTHPIIYISASSSVQSQSSISRSSCGSLPATFQVPTVTLQTHLSNDFT